MNIYEYYIMEILTGGGTEGHDGPNIDPVSVRQLQLHQAPPLDRPPRSFARPEPGEVASPLRLPVARHRAIYPLNFMIEKCWKHGCNMLQYDLEQDKRCSS